MTCLILFGDTSPIRKLYELNGYVLLIGVGYDKNTSLHLTGVRAKYPGKHMVIESSAIQLDGQRIWKSYQTLAVDGEDFSAIGEAFEQTKKVRHVPLGNVVLSMMSQRELVDFAVKWIEKTEHDITMCQSKQAVSICLCKDKMQGNRRLVKSMLPPLLSGRYKADGRFSCNNAGL